MFVVQRPDVSAVRPFREVDPEFADLPAEAAAAVGVGAIATAFDPPAVRVSDRDVPVRLA